MSHWWECDLSPRGPPNPVIADHGKSQQRVLLSAHYRGPLLNKMGFPNGAKHICWRKCSPYSPFKSSPDLGYFHTAFGSVLTHMSYIPHRLPFTQLRLNECPFGLTQVSICQGYYSFAVWDSAADPMRSIQ